MQLFAGKSPDFLRFSVCFPPIAHLFRRSKPQFVCKVLNFYEIRAIIPTHNSKFYDCQSRAGFIISALVVIVALLVEMGMGVV